MAEPNGKKVIDALLFKRAKWAIRSGVSKVAW
jgi:hypothetical protein